MAEKKKVSYKSGLEILLKNNFHSEKLDTSGLKLISELLNEVNSLLVYHIETEYSSVDKVDGHTFLHCARKAIDENFPGDLKANALSEAYKQLALLESGCLVYRKDATKVKGKSKNDKDTELKKIKGPIRLFQKGIGKMLSAMFPSYKTDSKAIRPLALSIHAFCEMASKRASEIAGQIEELQPTDLKEALPEYLENNALKVALGEANRCLVLYEKGLIKFDESGKCESYAPQENIVSEKIVPKAFEPGIKKLLHEIGPAYEIDARSKRYLAHILMDLAQYIAENTSETCQEKNVLEMKHGDIHHSIGATFPRELKEHTHVNCSKDVLAFQHGMIPYQRSAPVKSKKQAKVKKSSPKARRKSSEIVSKKSRKSSTVAKKRKTSKSSKRSPSPKKRRSKSPSKRKTPSKQAKVKRSSPKPREKSPAKVSKESRESSAESEKSRESSTVSEKSHESSTVSKKSRESSTVAKKRTTSRTPKRSPPSKKRRSKSPPKDVKPSKEITEKRKFARSIMSSALEEFSSTNVSLTKESESNSIEILEEICNALINTSVSHSPNTKEMDIEDIKGALKGLFPPELAKHALSAGLNAVIHVTHSNP